MRLRNSNPFSPVPKVSYRVNLGGWLVLEPLVVPSLFEPYVNAVPPAQDEWTLSQAMAADTANGGLAQLEKHYDTFIVRPLVLLFVSFLIVHLQTEEDFAQIAGAGLNWVRLPIPYWAIETYPDEPFLERVVWKYVLKAFKWARKYGLRISLDLRTIPGSQNGFNHSGKSMTSRFEVTLTLLIYVLTWLQAVKSTFFTAPWVLPMLRGLWITFASSPSSSRNRNTPLSSRFLAS